MIKHVLFQIVVKVSLWYVEVLIKLKPNKYYIMRDYKTKTQ